MVGGWTGRQRYALQFLTTFECSNAFSHVNKEPLSVHNFLVLIFACSSVSHSYFPNECNRNRSAFLHLVYWQGATKGWCFAGSDFVLSADVYLENFSFSMKFLLLWSSGCFFLRKNRRGRHSVALRLWEGKIWRVSSRKHATKLWFGFFV